MSKADWTDLVSNLLSVGAMFVQVLLGILVILGLAALVSAGARRMLDDLSITLRPAALWLAFGFALVATLGSLFYSEIADFIPCRLCWFQRIAMYPLVVIGLAAALRRSSREALAYGLALPIIGAAVSIYHIYIEYHPEAESASCKASGAPCTVKWIDKFGYITIPVLALTAFAAIAVLLVAARRGSALYERG